ncbi:MAG: preprotein translocase subunit SecG [Phycisphaerales bacterium]|nr:preprotein translocase subunit SecG [Phycisphaerales bacterium]
MDLTHGILNPALLHPALLDHGMLTLGVSQVVIGLLTVGFLACSVLLILTVLIQRPQGGGLSGAFGAGAGSGETAFGARTGDALTIATISFFVLWLVVAVGLVLVMSPPKVTGGNPAATSNPAPVQPGDTGAAPEQPAPELPAPETPAETPATETPGADETPGAEIPATEQPAGETGGEAAPPTDDGQGG